MSDLNDDLLNYELGEELDEQSLLVADEDDLLLSDEELEKDKAILKNEAEEWVNNKLGLNEENESNTDNICIKEPEVSTSSSYQKQQFNNEIELSHKITKRNNSESDVSTSGESPVKNNLMKNVNSNVDEKKVDEVTSTNKENEADSGLVQPQCSNLKDYTILSSQESSNVENSTDQDVSEEYDDRHERGERTNIKHTSERDDNVDSSPEKFLHGNNRYSLPKRGGRGGMRGSPYPGQRSSLPVRPNQFPPPHQYQHQIMSNTMANRPQFHPQNNLMNGPRLEYRPNFRSQNPNDFNSGILNARGPRPDFTQNHPNGVPFNNFQPRPMFRQDMPHMRPRMPLRPPSVSMQTIHSNVNNFTMNSGVQIPPIPQHSHPVRSTIPSHSGNMSAGNLSAPTSSASVLPRKVLINPNFKGGVEAATNQLMKDTQFMQTINSHVPHLQSDEELLRQQEEFINKNRIHIQKRYARSPNRSRERSYSPVRKDRYFDNKDNKRGFNSARGKVHCAGSREADEKFLKRRRSSSPDRNKDKDRFEEAEDEETRAYRLKIEKQKAMREKILRDKEMRRRRAAEGKTQTELLENTSQELPPTKLKPIIVTESKIISLKKNKDAERNANPTTVQITNSDTQPSQSLPVRKTLPTAKILPEAKKNISEHLKKDLAININSPSSTTAVVKPVIKHKAITTAKIQQSDLNKDVILDDYQDEDELLDEERLLADTPSPLESVNEEDNLNNDDDSSEPLPKKAAKTFMCNRKVVLKSSIKSSGSKTTTSKSADSKERIFDRLEKKKIGVNENDKRKIQRIFIKNAE